MLIIFSFKSVSGLNAKTDDISSESLLDSIILKLLSKWSLNNLNFSMTFIELPIISIFSDSVFLIKSLNFDSSISMINRGKIRFASKNNQKLPLGVALDKFGKPTIDANKALKGVQLPIAGFRGSGLAWMVDILSGVLTGGNHAGRVKDPFEDFTGPQNIGHLFITFKTNLFVKDYNQRIKDNIKRVKRLPKVKGIKEIMYPGQNKYKRYKMNLKKEIKISKIIKKELETLIN